jgi:dipeptidyl aminopeptidase/acylaminoacyl peptidase
MNVIHKLVWLVMLIAANVTAQDLELLQVADYLDYERVSGAQISPDGRQVIYTRLWVDQQKDRTSSALWIVNVDGSSNRFLVQDAAARWSPSGDRILFIANDANAKPQLFVR